MLFSARERLSWAVSSLQFLQHMTFTPVYFPAAGISGQELYEQRF